MRSLELQIRQLALELGTNCKSGAIVLRQSIQMGRDVNVQLTRLLKG